MRAISIIIAFLATLCLHAEERFGPTPGTEENPLLNVDFKITGISPFWFQSYDGPEVSFRTYVGYEAEYADGTIETDSLRCWNNPAQNIMFALDFPYVNAEYLIKPEWVQGIDEATKTITYSSTNSERLCKIRYDDMAERILDALRNGRQEFGSMVAGEVINSDDISYDKYDPDDEHGGGAWIYAPGVIDSSYIKGFRGWLYIYDRENDPIFFNLPILYIVLENGVTVHNVYFEEYNTEARFENPELLNLTIETTPLGSQYGYDETIKVDMNIDLEYCGYVIKSHNSQLLHYQKATAE